MSGFTIAVLSGCVLGMLVAIISILRKQLGSITDLARSTKELVRSIQTICYKMKTWT